MKILGCGLGSGIPINRGGLGYTKKNFKKFFKKSLDLKIKTIITVVIMKLNRPFPVYSKLGAQNATLRARCCPVCFMRM